MHGLASDLKVVWRQRRVCVEYQRDSADWQIRLDRRSKGANDLFDFFLFDNYTREEK